MRSDHPSAQKVSIRLPGEPTESGQPTDLQVTNCLEKVTLTRIVGKNHTQFRLSAAEAQSVADSLQRLLDHVYEHGGGPR